MGSCSSKSTATTNKGTSKIQSNLTKIPTFQPKPQIVVQPISFKPILNVESYRYTPPNFQLTQIERKSFQDTNEKIKVKVPINAEKTQFIWKQQQSILYPLEIQDLPIETIKNAKFQEKLTWFRRRLEIHRISWQQGSQILRVDRLNILFSSLPNLKNINLHKELKVQFSDEKVDDAGGLLRQWMHLCVKQIMKKQTGIFKCCSTDQIAYRFVWDKNVVEDLAIEAINLLGIIIGKAIFQRISLNCYLNHTILRQICSQPIHIQDVYSYDKKFYQSWVEILKTDRIAEMYLDGCAYHTHGQNDLEQIELFPNGKNTSITNQNRQLFISQMIQLHCTKSVLLYIQALKQSIYKVIPSELLTIFQPYELQMMLNGPFTIDVRDWRIHTQYQNLNSSDELARWFWQIVERYDQQNLKNLLHYCTGSLRVPILGFKHLESNRGEIKPFTLRMIDYTVENPYPKSHTCFNRLQIPNYRSKQQMRERLKVISNTQFSHFGLS